MARQIKAGEVSTIRKLIMANQGGLCAICKTNLINTGKIPALDHDHDFGHLRGVLCANCNGIEGKVTNLANRAKRNFTYLEWLKFLVAYLELHQLNRTGLIHHTHMTEDQKREKRNLKARQVRAAKKVQA